MSNRISFGLVLALPFFFAACEGDPVAPAEALAFSYDIPAVADQPVSGTFLVTGVCCGDQTITPGDVRLNRGFEFTFTVLGDITGEVVLAQLGNYNANGDGGFSGPISGTLSWNGASGGVSGTGGFVADDFTLSGTFVLHGEGELAGLKFKFYTEGPFGGPFPYTGNVVSPAM